MLGVTGEGDTGVIDDAFVDRGGYHGIEFVVHASLNGTFQRV